MKFETFEYIIPVDMLSAIINNDYSGLDENNIISLTMFLDNVELEHGGKRYHWGMPTDDIDFCKYFTAYHDLQKYEMPACDCVDLLLMVASS